MRPHIRIMLFLLFSSAAVLSPDTGSRQLSLQATALAGETAEWRREFDDICGRTMDAQGMSREELAQLISRCDKLRPQIEKLEESERKVFLRRLQMCSDLYKYVLDWKRENNR